jgi:alpha,alpha-trehalase
LVRALPDRDSRGDPQVIAGKHSSAECESGWDFNPRFCGRCRDFAPVDVNAPLHGTEIDLSEMHLRAGDSSQAADFARAAAHREALIDRFLWDPDARLYRDCDFVNSVRSSVAFAAISTANCKSLNKRQRGNPEWRNS